MSALSAKQRGLIETLIGASPDSVVRTLDTALAGETSGAMGEIRQMIRAETAERSARNLTFAPLTGLQAAG